MNKVSSQDGEARFRIGTGAIIINDEDEILLGLRGPKARDQHYKWELLGGLLQFGETPEEAIKREVKEEAGIEIEPLYIIGNNTRYDEKTGEQWVGFTFLCRHLSGKPHRTEFDRVLEFKWKSLEETFKCDLTPMTRYQLEQYQEFSKSK